MALADLKDFMSRCVRCSSCKWVPTSLVQSYRFATGCPSIQYGNLHAYSGGGKVITAMGLVSGKADYSDEVLKSIHACSMCGLCDISCKSNYAASVGVMETLRELRIKCVEDGQIDPTHLAVIDGLKKEDNTLGRPKADRARWADGLGLKDILQTPAEVYLHVGCRFSYDEGLWPTLRGAVRLLRHAGVDLGFAAKDETCCGGRAYEMGYAGECRNFAESTLGRIKASGAKTVLTCCSDCFGTYQQLFPLVGQSLDGVEVVHITQYLARLIDQGRLALTKPVRLRVTYHDPCHLGRLGEAVAPWKGTLKKALNTMIVTDPPKEVAFGANGVYEAPRAILRQIPGLAFTEMERIREYSYCCGAGGGALEAYPDFAGLAGRERLEEAESTGAEAVVTACPWCERHLRDVAEEAGSTLRIHDVVDLVLEAAGIGEDGR